jgi:hypothetical protein
VLQSRVATVGFAKQSAKASLETDPAYEIGVNSGTLAGIDFTEEDLPISWSSRMVQGHDRTQAIPTTSFESLAMPKSLGLLLQAAVGQDTISGAGDPYSHLFEPIVALPYLTMFSRRNDEYAVIGDGRVSELVLTWEKTGALKVSASVMGCTYEFDASAPTPDAQEKPAAGIMKGCGGTFQYAGNTAVITGGSITINNSVDAIFGSDSVLPADVFPALHTVDVSLTIVPENLDEFQRAATGTTGGATVSCLPIYTTADMSWSVGNDADRQLTFDVDRMKTMVAFPEVQSSGGPVELSVEGSIAEAASGTTYDFTLTNDVSTAY